MSIWIFFTYLIFYRFLGCFVCFLTLPFAMYTDVYIQSIAFSVCICVLLLQKNFLRRFFLHAQFSNRFNRNKMDFTVFCCCCCIKYSYRSAHSHLPMPVPCALHILLYTLIHSTCNCDRFNKYCIMINVVEKRMLHLTQF